ncbi:MAG: YaiO family outer membrane beta-barrel protein [Proteobacteria bacterium]|nr:YaiO family outer membrane beta-barrel protein [Pseudomonadota bacterium]
MRSPFGAAALLLLALGAPALAQTDHFAAGNAARRSGDFPAAERSYRAAVEAAPQSAEAWNALALVQGYQARYADALESVNRAEALAPNDLDISLTKARVLAWSMRYEEAARLVDRVAAARPKDSEALALRGRIAFYRTQNAEAERAFNAALAADPQNLDAVLGLGDVERARGNDAAARTYFLRAREIDPGSKDVADRLATKQPDGPLWRLDVGGTHSWLDRTALPDWSSQSIALTRMTGAGSYVTGAAGRYRRFGMTDVELTAAAGAPLMEGVSARLEASVTPAADFLPRWRLAPSVTANIFDETALMLEGSVRHYATGTVSGFNVGGEQFFMERRLSVSGRFINSIDDTGKHLTGWSAGVTAIPMDRISVRASYANAPESDAGIVADTRSWSAGLGYDITPTLTVRADFTHDNRSGGYLRDEVSIGIAVRF